MKLYFFIAVDKCATLSDVNWAWLYFCCSGQMCNTLWCKLGVIIFLFLNRYCLALWFY